MGMRLLTLAVRFAGRRWALAGGARRRRAALPRDRLVHPPLHVELAVEVGLVGVAVLDAAAGEQLGQRLDVVARRAACPRRAAAR